MEIATSSAEDSSQMRSIALVTMVFLPGTFFAVSLTPFPCLPLPDRHDHIVSDRVKFAEHLLNVILQLDGWVQQWK
jgi:hypothetical protein